MVTWGSPATKVLDDGWTVSTVDGLSACHWEHTVAVHKDGIWVTTAVDGGAAELADWGVTPVRPA
jgi:methionyl aminopeptidase